jgi:ABC-2 type transport system permease protein
VSGGWASQLRHQAGFDLLVFRRNPASTFFTVIFPLIFLFLFIGIFGNDELAGGVRAATLFVPGILALAVVSSTLVNAAITMTFRRERGVLKRVRGTPLRPWVFIVAQAAANLAISAFMTVLVVGIGALVFDVSVVIAGIPPLVVTLVVGASAFNALGLALTAAIPSEEAAPAVTNAVVLPLYFISDVFIVGDKPEVLERIASVFPIQHLAAALGESFDPFADGVEWPWQHWLVLGLWGIGGVLVTLRTFRWTPRR